MTVHDQQKVISERHDLERRLQLEIDSVKVPLCNGNLILFENLLKKESLE
jgi:hypothetical protein